MNSSPVALFARRYLGTVVYWSGLGSCTVIGFTHADSVIFLTEGTLPSDTVKSMRQRGWTVLREFDDNRDCRTLSLSDIKRMWPHMFVDSTNFEEKRSDSLKLLKNAAALAVPERTMVSLQREAIDILQRENSLLRQENEKLRRRVGQRRQSVNELPPSVCDACKKPVVRELVGGDTRFSRIEVD